MTERRRLAAILVADVVGYSKHIGSDEAGTLTTLQALRLDIIGSRSWRSTLGGSSRQSGTASSSSSRAPCRR
jgi:hypothetical protein